MATPRVRDTKTHLMRGDTLTVRVNIVDDENDVVGTQEVLLTIDSEPLTSAIEALTEAVNLLREHLELKED